MPISIPSARAYVLGSVAVALLALSSSAQAQETRATLELVNSKRPIEVGYVVNPVTLLRQAIATLIRSIDSQSAAHAFTTNLNDQPLSVDFASRAESERVSLILAESQLRVRIRQDLQLHCEVSSTDETDREPELGIDLAVQFKF